MTLVVDASAVVAALTNGQGDGEWARGAMQDAGLVGPGHLHVEVSNVLRRLVLAGLFPRDLGALAHEELIRLRITTYEFQPLAARIWALHPNVTAYDAASVALAEQLELPLLTVDRRLARADGPNCEFLTPPD